MTPFGGRNTATNRCRRLVGSASGICFSFRRQPMTPADGVGVEGFDDYRDRTRFDDFMVRVARFVLRSRPESSDLLTHLKEFGGKRLAHRPALWPGQTQNCSE